MNVIPYLFCVLVSVLLTAIFMEQNNFETFIFNEDRVRLNLNEDEQAYISKHQVFTYCVDPAWPPFEWIDEHGKHRGYISEYMGLIEKSLNIKLKLVSTSSWADTLDKSKRRECDLISAAMLTHERTLHLYFTQPYLTYSFAVASHKDAMVLDGEVSLDDKDIAIVKGYAYEEQLRINYPKIQLKYVSSAEEGLKQASAKHVFGYLDSKMVIAYLIHKKGFMNLKVIRNLPEHMALSIAVRNDNELLLSIMNKAVDGVDENKKRDIQTRWENKYKTSKSILVYTNSIYWFYTSLFCLGFAAILYFWTKSRVRKSKIKVQLLEAQVHKLEQFDSHYNAYHRHYLVAYLRQLWHEKHRQSLPFLICQIDQFDNLKTLLSIEELEALLQDYHVFISGLIPANATYGQWQMERSVVVGEDMSHSDFLVLAETIRYEVHKSEFAGGINVTVSIVIADGFEKDSLDCLFEELFEHFALMVDPNQVVLCGATVDSSCKWGKPNAYFK